VLERFSAYAVKEQEEGTTRLPEVFRAESQRAQLDYDRVLLAELAAAEEVHLRSLLALPPETPLAPIESAGAPSLLPGIDAVQGRARETNQELRIAKLRRRAAELRSSLADQRWWPDLTLGATYIQTDRIGMGLNPEDDGKDPLILQLGLSLPLWWNRNRAEQARSSWLATAAAEDVSARREELRSEIARTWWKVANTERLVRLYRKTLLPQAEAAALAAETFFRDGKGSFAGLLETVAAWHSFLLAEARARADHAQAVAVLERWIGRPLELVEREGGE
jgi:outer membrane protein TolC